MRNFDPAENPELVDTGRVRPYNDTALIMQPRKGGLIPGIGSGIFLTKLIKNHR